MKYTLELMSTNRQRIGTVLEASCPFGSYSTGSVFYLAANKAQQVASVQHMVVLDERKEPVVQTRLILGQDVLPFKGDDDSIPWNLTDNTVPWPGL